MKVQLDKGAYMPEKAYPNDACFDLRTPECFTLKAKGFYVCDTGVHLEIPSGMCAVVKSKSGLMCKHGITTDGTVDAGYEGSIRVCLFNHSDQDYEFRRGDKVAQLKLDDVKEISMERVDKISGGERGDNGFGSTGR